MQVLCGTDIIEISRIKEAIQKEKFSFIKKVYTEKEIEYCEAKHENKYQHYAARFAAKEAVFKAVSSLLDNKYDLSWQNIEVQNTEDLKPIVNFIDIELKEIKNIDISISHCKEYAVAMVAVVI